MIHASAAAPFFLIVETDDMSFEVVDNASQELGQGAGIQSARLMADKGVQHVLTGNCGPNAHQTLSAVGIDVIVGCNGTVQGVIEQFKAGQFKPAGQPNVPGHAGMGADNRADSRFSGCSANSYRARGRHGHGRRPWVGKRPGPRAGRAVAAWDEDVVAAAVDSNKIYMDQHGDMVRIAIASGKGGTGKTTLAANLAVMVSRQGRSVAYLDCDVEEPNGHLFLKPNITKRDLVTIARAVGHRGRVQSLWHVRNNLPVQRDCVPGTEGARIPGSVSWLRRLRPGLPKAGHRRNAA